MAGLGQAFVQIALTMFSNKPRGARAGVTADTVETLSSVQTARFPGAGLGGTVIYIHLTLNP